jgi:hypothetical protein
VATEREKEEHLRGPVDSRASSVQALADFAKLLNRLPSCLAIAISAHHTWLRPHFQTVQYLAKVVPVGTGVAVVDQRLFYIQAKEAQSRPQNTFNRAEMMSANIS